MVKVPKNSISYLGYFKGVLPIEPSNISYLKDNLLQKDFDAIFTELKLSEDGRLKPIYDKFEGKYSYITIRLVRLFLEN